MRRYQSLSFIAGILVVPCYLVFALLAYSQYPLPYSPLSNWLSDLGNADSNPHGAILYNLGIISTALLLMVFFIGLSRWRIVKKKVQIIMLLLTQFFGILGSVCMIMSAIFPINLLEVHQVWSMSLYFMLATAFAFSVAALGYHHKVPRWLLAIGVCSALMVNLTSFFPKVYVLEWITVFIFLSYVGLVGFYTTHITLSVNSSPVKRV